MVSRRALSLALRFGVAAVGLVLAFRLALAQSDRDLASLLLDAWQRPPGESLAWFALAWALLGANLAVGALRFQGLLRGVALPVRIGGLLRAYLVASFFNLVLPGAILGDVYRFWDARRDTGEGARVFAAVVIERVLSIAALGAIAVVVSPMVSRIETDRALFWTLVATGLAFVLGSGAALLPATNRSLRRLAAAALGSFPRLALRGERALEAAGALSSSPAVLARAFGWSLVNQALPIAAIMVLAVPLEAGVAWYWYAVIVPFVTLVSLLPISVGGTGVRELLYVSLFGAVGMGAEAALTLSLSVLVAALAWGLVGLALFGLDRRDDLHPAESRP